MARKLYIVQGLHYPESEEQPATAIARHVEVRMALIDGFARRYRVERLFFDSVDASLADEYNGLLAQLARQDKKMRRAFFRETMAAYTTTRDQDYEFNLTMKTCDGLQRDGIPLRFYPTERPDFAKPHEVLKDAMDEEVVQILAKENDGKLPPEFPYRSHPLLRDVWVSLRDKAVFEDVCRQGGDHNILFMGSGHPLLDFEHSEHDFHVYRLLIEGEEFLRVAGTVPEGMRRRFDHLEKKYPDISFQHEFKEE